MPKSWVVCGIHRVLFTAVDLTRKVEGRRSHAEHVEGLGPQEVRFPCYSNGAIGTTTGFAGAGLGALSAGFAAGASGTCPDGIARPSSGKSAGGNGAASE